MSKIGIMSHFGARTSVMNTMMHEGVDLVKQDALSGGFCNFGMALCSFASV